MKRDLELIRKILIEIENKTSVSGWIVPELNGYAQDQIHYHIYLLGQANLIEVQNISSKESVGAFAAKNLTWAGHEFLNATRNDTLWQKIKSSLGRQISEVTFDVIKDIASHVIKRNMGLES